MPFYLTEKQAQIWAFSPTLEADVNIATLLTKMAIYRQAKLDPVTLEAYTQYLLGMDMRAFQVAMAMLAESPREDGQTAFPSLGDILSAMEEAREVWPDFAAGRKKILTDPVFAEPQPKRLKA